MEASVPRPPPGEPLHGVPPDPLANDPFGGGLAFREVGEHAREKYLDFPYTKGTKQEARFLRDALGLPDDALVLDVACGVGRHEPHLPWRVVGADLTRGLLEVARRDSRGAGWVQAEARALPFRPVFDGAWSVCEGAFGLLPDDAAHVAMLRSVRACLKPGAPFILSAMSVFAMCADEHFDPLTNTMSTPQAVLSPSGKRRRFVVTARAFTPREVVAMAREAGFEVEHVWGGITGAYRRRALTVEDAEMLVLMRKGRAGARGGEGEEGAARRALALKENRRRADTLETPICPTCAALGLGFVEMAMADDAPHAGGLTLYQCPTHGDIDWLLE